MFEFVAGNTAGDGIIVAQLFNGATEVKGHAEKASIFERVARYDCYCTVIIKNSTIQ